MKQMCLCETEYQQEISLHSNYKQIGKQTQVNIHNFHTCLSSSVVSEMTYTIVAISVFEISVDILSRTTYAKRQRKTRYDSYKTQNR